MAPTDPSRITRRSLSLLALTLACGPTPAPAGAEPGAFERQIKPLLAEFCLKCHSTEEQKGDLDLEQVASPEGVRRHPKIWQEVWDQLNHGEMPPKDKPQPAADQKEQLMAWVRGSLDTIALERAGDPGPVVLRRLSNAEYTYTIRDLTGVESLDPAREFPVDGAAGEGFTNTGQSLVMSPSMVTKYLDAAKGIASHAVLLPDGIRFSRSTTRRDWTEEILGGIRRFYDGFTVGGGTETVVQQGIALDKNKGGGLPLDRYLAASLELRGGGKPVEAVARERGLSPKYLGLLLGLMQGQEPSPLLDGLRARWQVATPEQVPAMVPEIAAWQSALWKFSSVGHIGKLNGPKAWMEPVSPLVAQQELRLKTMPAAGSQEVVLYLAAGDAGDGARGDEVVWQQPRLILPGRPPLLLRDLRAVAADLTARRNRLLEHTARALTVAAGTSPAAGDADLPALARQHGVPADVLQAWFGLLGLQSGTAFRPDYLSHASRGAGGYDFVKGWDSPDLPALLVNTSGEAVRVPGHLKAHGLVVHPSPTMAVAVGWRSPVSALLRIEATVTDAHTDCGNGVTWSLDWRRGNTRQTLASGVTVGSEAVPVGPVEALSVQPGDVVSLVIGPRDAEHTCDLTDLEFKLSTTSPVAQEWSLTREVTGDILAGNPHADGAGHEGVWHFYKEPVSGLPGGKVIPAGSMLARWLVAETLAEKQNLAGALQLLLNSTAPPAGSPDAALFASLTSLTGPLISGAGIPAAPAVAGDSSRSPWGLDPALFGKGPRGSTVDEASLWVQAPSVIELRLPAELVAGGEFVTTGVLDPGAGPDGSVQLQLLTTKPAPLSGLQPSGTTIRHENGLWSSNNQAVSFGSPIVVKEGSAAYQRFETVFDEFRRMFPAALCYTKIVPVDEVVTLTLFHREDGHLARLLLDDAQQAQLDRMWDELRYVSQDALTLVDAFEQLWQFATQDADPKAFEPLRQPILDRAAAFRQRLVDTEPGHVRAVLEWADHAYRRPLSDREQAELHALYRRLREQELPHGDAISLMLAKVLVGPAFLYKAEQAPPGKEPAPVSDVELANRLSYFLWSSPPDAELRGAAAAGTLHEPEQLLGQTRRMLRDPRMRRMATEFGCAWLHIHGFDSLDEKSERHFPGFPALRGAMYEESIRFFTDFFREDRPVPGLLEADFTFLNEALARHYGIPGVTGETWRRVDGVRQFSRGGILGQAAVLAKHSGASRTSPILRGNWVAEVLLGDKLPPPPKDVPQLPEDEANTTLTVRQLTVKHSSDPRCSGCHSRIDPFGFALEGFDAIGQRRGQDSGGRPIDTRTRTLDGIDLSGLEGLRDYLLTKRRDAFLRQFCRKLLGYALGRSVQLSDEPLLKEMQTRIISGDSSIGTAIAMIAGSRQFREIRGRDAAFEE